MIRVCGIKPKSRVPPDLVSAGVMRMRRTQFPHMDTAGNGHGSIVVIGLGV